MLLDLLLLCIYCKYST